MNLESILKEKKQRTKYSCDALSQLGFLHFIGELPLITCYIDDEIGDVSDFLQKFLSDDWYELTTEQAIL